MRIFTYLFTFFILQAVQHLQAQTTYSWTGANSSDWANAGNWSPTGVPGPGDLVNIDPATNNPMLDSSRSIASLSMSSGSELDLGGYALTLSTGGVFSMSMLSNGMLISSDFHAEEARFGVQIITYGSNFTSLNSRYSNPGNFTFTGSALSASGGNSFSAPVYLTHLGSGTWNFGSFDSPDVFEDSLIALCDASGQLVLGSSSTNNQMLGYCLFKRGINASNNAICIGSDVSDITFFEKVELASQGATGTKSTIGVKFEHCLFENTASLRIHSDGFSRCQLSLVSCDVRPPVALALSGSASLLLSQATVFRDSAIFTAPSCFLHKTTFEQYTSITKTGTEIDQSPGPIVSLTDIHLINTGNGSLFFDGATDEEFQHVYLRNEGPGTLAFARKAGNSVVFGNLDITCLDGLILTGVYSNNRTLHVEGEITTHCYGGQTILGRMRLGTSGSIVVDTLDGALKLENFDYDATIPFEVDKPAGGGRLILSTGSDFASKVKLTIPRIQMTGVTFHDSLIVNCHVQGLTSSGGLTCHGAVVLNAYNSVGMWELNYAGTPSTYYGNVYMNRFGAGQLDFGLYGSHHFKKNLYFNGTGALGTSGVYNNHMTFNGSENQIIASTNSHITPLARLQVDKPSGQLQINSKVSIWTNLNLTKGHVVVDDAGSLTMFDTCSVNGGSDSSYVQGSICKSWGTAEVTYPLGADGVYAPLKTTAIGTNNTFRVTYFGEDPDSLYSRSAKDTTIGYINRCGYWKVERLAGSTNVTPTLGWSNNPCYSTSPIDASVAQWDGSTWKDKGNAAYSGTSTAGEVKSTAAITSYPAILNLGGICNLEAELTANRDTLIEGYLATFTASPANQSNYKFYVNGVLKQDGESNEYKSDSLNTDDVLSIQITNLDNCSGTDSISIIALPFNQNILNDFLNQFSLSTDVFSPEGFMENNTDTVKIYGEALMPEFSSATIYALDTIIDDNLQIQDFKAQLDTLEAFIAENIGFKLLVQDSLIISGGIYSFTQDSSQSINIISEASIGENSLIFFHGVEKLDSNFTYINQNNFVDSLTTFVFSQKVIIGDGFRFTGVVIADTIEYVNSTPQEYNFKSFSRALHKFSNTANLSIRSSARILLQSSCPNYNDTICSRVPNGIRFDVNNQYPPAGTIDPFTSGFVCGWSRFGSNTPTLGGVVTPASDNSAEMWALDNGNSEGIMTNLPLNLVSGTTFRISFDHRIIENTTNGLDNLPRYFVILSSLANPPASGLTFNWGTQTYRGLPFNSGANYVSVSINGTQDRFVYNAGNNNEQYLIISQSDNNIANAPTQEDLSGINSAFSVWNSFSRTFTIPSVINGINTNTFNTLILTPKRQFGGLATTATYTQIDNVEIYGCCPSTLELRDEITTIEDLDDPILTSGSDVYFSQAGALNTISTGFVSINNPGPYLHFTGNLIVDDDLLIENSNLILDDNSRIRVLSGATLTISNSWIHGCRVLWEDIRVEDGGTLIMNDVTIQDANIAIQGTENFTNPSPARIEIYDSELLSNRIHINLSGNGQAGADWPLILSGNNFSCPQMLLPISYSSWLSTGSITNAFTNYCINLRGVGRVVPIGIFGGSSSQLNKFQEAYNGVRAQASSCRIDNNLFININPTFWPNSPQVPNQFNGGNAPGAIVCFGHNGVGNGNANILIDIGANSDFAQISAGNTISDSRFGLFTTRVINNLWMEKTSFENIRNVAISALNHDASTLVYSKNTVEDVSQFGFEFRELYNSRITVLSNLIDNTNLTNDVFPATGIAASNTLQPLNNSFFEFSDNELVNFRFGFDINNVGRISNVNIATLLPVFTSNIFNLFYNNTVRVRIGGLGQQSFGFRLQNCPRTTMVENAVVNFSTSGVGNFTTGLDFSRVSGSLFACNVASEMEIGYNFHLNNQGGTRLWGNRMDNLSVGLQLTNSLNGVGAQGPNEGPNLNSWSPWTDPSPFQAHLRSDNSQGQNSPFQLGFWTSACNTFNPWSPENLVSDLIPPGQSLITIPCSLQVNGVPNIFHDGGENDAEGYTACFLHEFFATPGTYFPAEEPDNDIIHRIEIISQNDTSLSRYLPEIRNTSRTIFAELYQNQSLLTNDTLSEFYDSLLVTTDGKLELIQLHHSMMDTLPEASYNDYSKIESWLEDNLAIMDSCISMNNSLNVSGDPLASTEKMLNSILFSHEKEKAEFQMDLITFIGNSINPDSTALAFLDSTIMIPSLMQWQKDTITTISEHCPFEWGSIVFEARAARAMFDTTSVIFNLCELSEPTASSRISAPKENKSLINNVIKVYPNPFNNNLTIKGLTDGEYKFNLFDVSSRLIYETKFSGEEEIQLSTSQIQPGIYFVEIISSSGKRILTDKLIK